MPYYFCWIASKPFNINASVELHSFCTSSHSCLFSDSVNALYGSDWEGTFISIFSWVYVKFTYVRGICATHKRIVNLAHNEIQSFICSISTFLFKFSIWYLNKIRIYSMKKHWLVAKLEILYSNKNLIKNTKKKKYKIIVLWWDIGN